MVNKELFKIFLLAVQENKIRGFKYVHEFDGDKEDVYIIYSDGTIFTEDDVAFSYRFSDDDWTPYIHPAIFCSAIREWSESKGNNVVLFEGKALQVSSKENNLYCALFTGGTQVDWHFELVSYTLNHA